MMPFVHCLQQPEYGNLSWALLNLWEWSPTFKRQVHHVLPERLRMAFDSLNTSVDDGSTIVQYDGSPHVPVE